MQKNCRGIKLLSIPGKVLYRIILERLRTAVDSKLREHQTGFQQERSCIGQIATMRITIEQSIEWNYLVYINFRDVEKAFDSLDREAMWHLMRHYGIPQKFISVIKSTYNGMTCRVLHAENTTDKFDVKTCVREGCILSPFLFLMAQDWIMRTATEGRQHGIRWTAR